ncbi:MAG: hypothetical protein C4324_03825 [Blastocatellia bacterium]
MGLKLTGTILFGVIVALIFGVDSPAKGQPSNIQKKAEAISGDRFAYATFTPRGVRILAAKRPQRAMLLAIDKGLADLFAIARSYGYTAKLRFSDYTVYIGQPDRITSANGSYSPDIAVPAGQYSGSRYDKGGYIYAAGIVISNAGCAFLLPEYSRDFELAAEVVRFEGEHIILFHNDRPKYNATADHSRGGGHPILK